MHKLERQMQQMSTLSRNVKKKKKNRNDTLGGALGFKADRMRNKFL